MRFAFIGLGLVLSLCIGAVVAWQLTLKTAPQPAQPAIQTRLPEPAVPANPKWFPVAAPAEPQAQSEAPAPAAPEPEEPLLTADTLKGTSWEDGQINMAFLPDGRWQMNGRICAKWEVLGNRVRIYDDKGEEHFVDIVGNNLAFNGKVIGKVKS